MKKALALVLCLSLLTGMLSGCAGGGSASASSTPASSAASTPASSDSTATNSEWPAIGTAEAPVKVTFILKDVFPNEPDIITLLDTIEQKMAAHGQYLDIELLEPPATDYKTALPLGVRSGDIEADLLYFQGGDLPIGQEGLLEDLTPYIASSKYIKDLMEPANVTRLQNYPYLLWLAPARVPSPVMRSDWAAQLDSYKALIENPTVDNYYAMAKEMKDKGLVQYPFSGDGGVTRIDTIFNHAFGVADTFVEQDGKWVFNKATSYERDKLEFYAKLYAEGMLDPEYLTNQWDVLEQKFYEGKVGILPGTAGAVIKIYDDKMQSTHGEAAALTVLPPAKGVSQAYTSINTTKEDRGFAIPVSSKNKEAAWALLEFMASPEGRVIDKLGIEGTHWKSEGGKIVFTEKFSEWWSRFWETTYKLESLLPEPLATPVYPGAAQDSLDMAQKYYYGDNAIIIPEELAPQYDAMMSLYNEYSTDIIRGVKPISAFDEFVTKWNAAGGDAFSTYLASNPPKK